jgi:complement component 1 Q subcomponent-binding protein
MLSLRNIARTAPRAARFTKAVRPQSSLLRQTAAFQPAWSQAAPRLTASFHVSAIRRQDGSGTMKSHDLVLEHLADRLAANEELVAKLQSEIAMEEDMKEDDDLSANIKEYLENSPFEV